MWDASVEKEGWGGEAVGVEGLEERGDCGSRSAKTISSSSESVSFLCVSSWVGGCLLYIKINMIDRTKKRKEQKLDRKIHCCDVLLYLLKVENPLCVQLLL